MTVAEMFRRNRKITRITSMIVSPSVSLTSCTDSRMVAERSTKISNSTAAGSCARSVGSMAFTASATSTVLVPGCFCTEIEMARVSLYQPARRTFCTPSTTCPRSRSRTGAPLR